MTGKVLEGDKNHIAGNKLNSNMVKISSAKSILSYQNGSAANSENLGCTMEERMPEERYTHDASPSEDPFTEAENLKSECLDLLRKKLISDLSLTVFSCDLENKLTKMEPLEISKERQSVIQKLVVQISQLSDPEKLLLYLKLPSSTSSPCDPLRQPLNPLGNRQEIQQTIVWIKTHLEEDSEISIPKQDVYDQYLKYCENVSMKPLSTADFGKVMKQVYPGVRPRRLGTRGNSRYCYSGMRNTCKLPTPILPRCSLENSMPHCCSSGVSPFLTSDTNKFKKLDKAKRKWTSSSCRNDKCVAGKKSSCLGSEKASAKRSKGQKEMESTVKNAHEETDEETERISHSKNGQSKNLGVTFINCEDCSENSVNACGTAGKPDNNLKEYKEENKGEDKGNGRADDTELKKDIPLKLAEAMETKNDSAVERRKPCENEDMARVFRQVRVETADSNGKASLESRHHHHRRDQTPMASNNHIAQRMNDLTLDKARVPRRIRKKSASSSLKQTNKNCKKSSYVPIQPKPADTARLSVRFEASQVSVDRRGDKGEKLTLCEESDSQEPEEEIIRYFKHLDEREMNGANNFGNEAVKNIDNDSVQINSISHVGNPPGNPIPYGIGGDHLLNQQILRSQSCFVGGRSFELEEKRGGVFLPRSQSSVELPTVASDSGSGTAEPVSGSDGRINKISHLRILLEKSINSPGNLYSRLSFSGNKMVVGAENQLNDSMNQVAASSSTVEPDFLAASGGKFTDRDLLKLNGLKVVSKNSSLVPESPNTRTKYFSFTPISPGPQSPLKTPGASPFVSPRDTPVPRSRQNSMQDHFLSPCERKPSLVRSDSLAADSIFNFAKDVGAGNNLKGKASRSPTAFVDGCRPRSFSSTNFYRSKSRRNSGRPCASGRGPNQSFPKSQPQSAANGFALSSPFSVQTVSGHFVSSESLSDEVQKFLGNNAKMGGNQVATIRSRSVPLNRMTGDRGNWVSAQASPVYSVGFFNSENGSDRGKMSNVAPGPNGGSGEVIPEANISGFDDSNGIFAGDPSIVALNDQYYSGDFQRPGEDTFSEGRPFNEDSSFSNKLDLNSSETFAGAFSGDSDAALTDNIKSYLPDFENLDGKNLAVNSGENREVCTDEKIFKSALYEGSNDNLKDPVITSFKPVLLNEMSQSPGSPALNFFGSKINEDSQQLIEFFDFED